MMSKVAAFGLVVATCVTGTTVPASASSVNDELRPAAFQFLTTGALSVAGSIELAPGKKLLNDGTDSFELLEGENRKQLGLQIRYREWEAPNTKVAYPIWLAGRPTNYWLQIHNWNEFFAQAECEIFDGEPVPGAEPAWYSPVKCESSRIGFMDKHWIFTVSRVKRDG